MHGSIGDPRNEDRLEDTDSLKKAGEPFPRNKNNIDDSLWDRQNKGKKEDKSNIDSPKKDDNLLPRKGSNVPTDDYDLQVREKIIDCLVRCLEIWDSELALGDIEDLQLAGYLSNNNNARLAEFLIELNEDERSLLRECIIEKHAPTPTEHPIIPPEYGEIVEAAYRKYIDHKEK